METLPKYRENKYFFWLCCLAMSASSPSQFPDNRMRRSRRHPWSRDLVREAHLSAADLIWPVFVHEGRDRREPVPSMPG